MSDTDNKRLSPDSPPLEACPADTPEVTGSYGPPDDAEATGPYRPQPPAAAPDGTPAGEDDRAGSRYRVLGPHAKGGLGEVFLAEDLELHRTIALKEIRQDYAHDPQGRGRFLLEAEVTGGLEHPGVVPVYGLGQYPDGRPFYAMRFIRGETLKEAVRRFHAADAAGRDADERRRALRELLRRFTDVCNAVAYAHSRGVLHRDLKPANVMLGPFGETLVVDWGLAKPLDRPEAAIPEETALRPQYGEAAGTLMGVAIGTPAYMSPEQAAGRQDLLGPAGDIYSLGATLYYLLTGKVPFQGRDARQVLRQVQAGDFPPPRRVNRKVPAGLEAICLRAMAREPKDRYPSALALAEDVDRWLADEPVTARREPWWERALRFCRRRPVLAGWIGFGLAENLAALLGLGGFLLWSYGVVIEPLWLNLLVFAPFLGFLWLLGVAGVMSFLAQWLGLVGLVVGFVLANYLGVFTRKRGRKRAVRAALLGGKVGLVTGALLGYAGSFYLLENVLGLRSALMWAALGAGAVGPLLGIGLLVRKAGRETRWKRAGLGAALGAVLGIGAGFTLSYVDIIWRLPDPTALLRDHGAAGWNFLPDGDQLPEPVATRPRQPGGVVRDDPAGFKTSEDFWQKVTTEHEEKVRQNPNDIHQVFQLAAHYQFRGNMAKGHGRPQEELDWYDKAVGTLEPVLRKKPSAAGFPDLLVSCYRARADALARLGRPAEALKDLDRALELKPWTEHHETRLRRALALARLGEHAQAVAEAEALHPGKNLQGETLSTFARVYALAASKAGADQALSGKYAARAVAALAMAKDVGYFKAPGAVARLKRDADFRALQGRDDFNELFAGR